jgi:hypothetical protein
MPSLIPEIAIAALCLRLSLPIEKNVTEWGAIALGVNLGNRAKSEPASADLPRRFAPWMHEAMLLLLS